MCSDLSATKMQPWAAEADTERMKLLTTDTHARRRQSAGLVMPVQSATQRDTETAFGHCSYGGMKPLQQPRSAERNASGSALTSAAADLPMGKQAHALQVLAAETEAYALADCPGRNLRQPIRLHFVVAPYRARARQAA